MSSIRSSQVSTDKNPADVLKILVATDIHLGYGEQNRILYNDSFITFEEILQIANGAQVDFILLGGDLFHLATPTPASLEKCIKLLRAYVLGDKLIDFEFLSDQNQNFPDSFHSAVNYEDNNLNVSIPVFSIHGNHDDVTGPDRLSSMDILSSTGLLNYFGKWKDLTKVEITPLVLKKGNTHVALYGLSHIHDARLARLFRDHLVKLNKPNIDDENIFNLMVLHQNRADRGRLNFLPEDKLPPFMDLVVWGHEHDCRIEPEQNPRTETYITQPGSSVATSLAEGESIEKKVGILSICGKDFFLKPVKLRTVRPFVFRSINIEEFVNRLKLNEGNVKDKVSKFYTSTIDEMIEEAEAKQTDNPKQPKVPLIRLRICYKNQDHVINPVQFGHKYEKIIANPESVLTFKKIEQKKAKAEAYNPDLEKLKKAFSKKEQQDCVEDVVEGYFAEFKDKDQLKTFNLKTLTEVCRLLVKGDDNGVSNIFESHERKAEKYLTEKASTLDEIDENLVNFRMTKSIEALDDVGIIIQSFVPSVPSSSTSANDVVTTPTAPKASTTRGKGKAKAPAKAPTASSTRGKKATTATQNKSTRGSKRSIYVDDSGSDENN